LRRKKLTEGPNDTCICGHKRNQHKHQKFVDADSYFTGCNKCEPGWRCDEFFDIRHAMIKWTDESLQYCRKFSSYIIQEEIWRFWKKEISRPTISRRIGLFMKAGLISQIGFAPIGDYSARCIVYQFNEKRYEELKKLGVIV